MAPKVALEAARAAVKFADEVFGIAENPKLAPIIRNSGVPAELRRQIAKMQAFVDALEGR